MALNGRWASGSASRARNAARQYRPDGFKEVPLHLFQQIRYENLCHSQIGQCFDRPSERVDRVPSISLYRGTVWRMDDAEGAATLDISLSKVQQQNTTQKTSDFSQ